MACRARYPDFVVTGLGDRRGVNLARIAVALLSVHACLESVHPLDGGTVEFLLIETPGRSRYTLLPGVGGPFVMGLRKKLSLAFLAAAVGSGATTEWPVACASAAPATEADAPAPRFIDLTKGDAGLPLPHPEPVQNVTPRTRFIDLSTDAATPADEAAPAEKGISDEAGKITVPDIGDPYEASNRRRFKTHVALHRYVIDPAERVYTHTVPTFLREALHNFLTNLETPAVLINDVLQGDRDRAGNTFSRFVVNSSIGLGGLLDVAGRAGILYRDDDFGQTLAHYGVGDSPYLLVPVIGPTNPRDLSGKVVDIFFNPLHYVAVPGGIATSGGEAGLHELDKRSEDVGMLDRSDRSDPDPYAMERDTARTRRRAETGGASASPPK